VFGADQLGKSTLEFFELRSTRQEIGVNRLTNLSTVILVNVLMPVREEVCSVQKITRTFKLDAASLNGSQQWHWKFEGKECHRLWDRRVGPE
jgi:hypothetical protein